MLKAFKQHITENLSFLSTSKLLVAISGGLDSVVLTHLCKSSSLNIALAHCNFNLRGEESDKDADFVANLATTLNVELFSQDFNTKLFAASNKLSTQMAARQLRYDWFFELSEHLNFDYILTAHHADDALETFLINLSRGSGIQGLLGIPEVNETIVRPLLPFSRLDVLNYAKANAITWREDSSNTSTKYLRNALRHEVIPKLKDIMPQFLNNFSQTLDHLNMSKQALNAHFDAITQKVIEKTTEQLVYFKLSELNSLEYKKAYLHYIFKTYNFTDWKAIINLLSAQSGKQVFSDTHVLLKDRNHLILSKRINSNFEELYISESENNINLPYGKIVISEVDKVTKTDCSTIFVDKAKIKFPLKIRKCQEGDYFYPFGMKGQKTLSKFFKDEKLSRFEKQDVLLLCSENEIVWVVNKRADNRFKITNATKHLLKITFNL